ncbi:MAG TPA: PilZ domain-containing protein [Thermoanaerobaculia bacterium]|nr:PilZ domain-containing protein [Thermoanaerobaculia bacterium]
MSERASRRVRVLCPAHYRSEEAEETAFATVVVVNERGLYLATPKTLSPGSEIEVSISLPGESATFRSKARVVDAYPTIPLGSGRVPGMGCAFVQPPMELVNAIHNLTQF